MPNKINLKQKMKNKIKSSMLNILWENKITKHDFSLLKSQFLLKFNLFGPLGQSYIHCSSDQIQKHECNYHILFWND